MSKSIELNFTHPRETDKSFAAEVDGECTVAEALQHLQSKSTGPVSYTHLRAHETVLDLVCRLLLEKKKTKNT